MRRAKAIAPPLTAAQQTSMDRFKALTHDKGKRIYYTDFFEANRAADSVKAACPDVVVLGETGINADPHWYKADVLLSTRRGEMYSGPWFLILFY